MMRIFRNLLAVGLISFTANTALAQDRPSVIAVNYPLHYFAERLLGDAAEVTFPVPQDVDPSFWRPSIADISTIQSADLILLNGAGFATWIDRVSLRRSKLVKTSAAIVDQFIITESITHSHGDGGQHSHEGLASYIWLDPSLAIAQAEAIATAITAKDLAPTEAVEARLERLRSDLGALDAQAQTALAPFQDITFIATHPRYQYFARRYGLSFASLEWDAGAMPSEADIADLQALVEETGASVLIWEAEPPAPAKQVATDLGLQNITFPTLAHGVEGQSLLETLTEVIAKISALDVQ